MRRRKKIRIVGAGFSGLIAGYYLAEQGHEIVFSEEKKIGGLLQTQRNEWGLAESAANAFILTEELKNICLNAEIPLIRPNKKARTRYVVTETPQALSLKIALLPVFRFLAYRATNSHQPSENESLYSWGRRVLGNQFAKDFLFSATLGVWGQTADHLSANLILGPYFKKGRAKRIGSVSPKEGMSQFTSSLSKYLEKKQVRFVNETISGVNLDADVVILATSAKRKAQLLSEVDSETSFLFSQMQASSALSITGYFSKTESKHPYPGFGMLFHPDYSWHAQGVLFNNQIFENRSQHQSETWIHIEPSPEKTDQDYINQIISDRKRLQMHGELLGFRAHRWNQALPRYTLAHETLLKKAAKSLDLLKQKSIFLLGNEMGEIGLTSLAEKAKDVADQISRIS